MLLEITYYNKQLVMTDINLKKHLESLFSAEDNLNFLKKMTFKDWDSILKLKPFEYAIEKEFSLEDLNVKKCLKNLELASYHSLSLTLMFGINIALFLEPLAKYGSEVLKEKVLPTFLAENKTGGLMITEPEFGTDALNMETTFAIEGDKVKIKGIKHWQGLTGQADYWLVAGKVVEDEIPSKQISFCLVPQENVTYELYETQGLKPIQYGVNCLDTNVPIENLLVHKNQDNSMILDILHRSRMQFVGMASGFVKRLLDDSVQATSNRIMRGKKLISMPEIKKNIIDLQTYYTLTKACYLYSSRHSGIENDLENDSIIANAIKVTVTNMMKQSSDLNIQLSGGNGFLDGHYGFHGLRDSRPFSIFEGPNDMLSNQILRLVLLGMKKEKYNSVFEYIGKTTRDNTQINMQEFAQFNYTLNDLLLRDVNKKEAMSKSLISIINLFFLEELKKTDFNEYLVKNAITYIKNDLISNYAILKSGTSYSPLELA